MTRFDPPAHYDTERRRIWDDTITQLTDGGRIFRADPRILDTYVQAAADHADAVRLRTESGGRVATTRDGHVIEHPLLAIQRKAAKELAAASRALGLDRPPPQATDTMTPAAPPPQHDGKCGGPTRAGGTCTQRAGWGTGHAGFGRCKLHGGASPGYEIHAARERVRLAPPIEISPGQGLLEEVHRSAGMVAWLEAECAQLPPESLWRGTTKQVDRDGVLETVTETRPHVKLAALYREREHFASVCDRALARGAEQQVIDVARTISGVAVRVIDKVLADLDLSAEQQARVPRVVPAAFRMIAGGQSR